MSDDGRHRPLRLIGAGGKRRCYAHPDDPALCIKVPYTSAGAREARREAAYLALLERLHGDVAGRHLARCLARVRTSLGTGWVFERVRDERSGRPSPTLGDALDERAYAAEREAWERALEAFVHWSDATAVVVRDLTPDNLCVRRPLGGGLELVMIDGVGPAALVPRWLPLRAYARRRNARSRARYGVTSMPELIERCRRQRAWHRRPDAPSRRGDADQPVWLLERAPLGRSVAS